MAGRKGDAGVERERKMAAAAAAAKDIARMMLIYKNS